MNTARLPAGTIVAQWQGNIRRKYRPELPGFAIDLASVSGGGVAACGKAAPKRLPAVWKCYGYHTAGLETRTSRE